MGEHSVSVEVEQVSLSLTDANRFIPPGGGSGGKRLFRRSSLTGFSRTCSRVAEDSMLNRVQQDK
jgi:hypothetical protein